MFSPRRVMEVVGHGGGEAGGGRGEPWRGGEGGRGGLQIPCHHMEGGREGGRMYGKGEGGRERDGRVNREANASGEG